MQYLVVFCSFWANLSMASSNVDAEYYNKNAQWQYKTASILINSLALNGNERVLDIGSGDGEVTKKIAQRVPNGYVHGIDDSPQMVKFAESNKGTVKNLSYQELGAEDLKANNKYDLITSFSTFYWINNQAKALNKSYQALKPGGRIYLLVFPKESPYWRPLILALQSPKFKKYYSSGQYQNFITTDEYREILAQLGFQSINIREATIIAEYANKEEYINYVRGWVRLFISLPTKNKEEEFLDLAFHKAREHFEVTPDGSVLIPYKKIIITASK